MSQLTLYLSHLSMRLPRPLPSSPGALAPRTLFESSRSRHRRIQLSEIRGRPKPSMKLLGPVRSPRGAERDRTVDLRLAKPALSQLSYSPVTVRDGMRFTRLVGQGRLELPTSRLSGVRSNHLSYWPARCNRRRARRVTEWSPCG